MADRIRFAHPDEEATFNRCRVYYSAPEFRALCVRCDACEACRDPKCWFCFDTGCPACSGEKGGDD